MYPKLIKIGPITIWSFGVMMALAFIATSWLLQRELRRRGIDDNAAGWITIAAIVGGIAGAKLFWAFEHFREFSRAPLRSLFTGAGLTWYGGLILAAIAVALTVKAKGKPFLQVADSIGPLIALGYAIGRMGCFLSGDGDYGPPSNLPWAMSFERGTVPPHLNPAIWKLLGTTDVPPDIRVHPTPLYEIAMSLPIFLFLWSRRKRYEGMPGFLFGMYMVLGGCERFVAEFWRLTPLTPFGLTLPQTFSLAMMAGGAVLMWYARSKSSKARIRKARGRR